MAIKAVRVQVPLRVLKKSESESESEKRKHSLSLFFLKTRTHTHTFTDQVGRTVDGTKKLIDIKFAVGDLVL